jgi:hypothetical protein
MNKQNLINGLNMNNIIFLLIKIDFYNEIFDILWYFVLNFKLNENQS